MKRYSRILALHGPGDRHDAAVAHAAGIARRDGARLTVLRVMEEFPRSLLAQRPSLAGLWGDAVRDAEENTARLAAELEGQGLEAQAKTLSGVPFIETIKEVLRGGYDLLVKGSDEQGPLKSVFLGSNDMHLLRKCPCPVLVLRHPRHEGFRRILAAVDPDPFNEQRGRLNLKILELAASFARAEGAALIIVHAWALVAEGLLRARSVISRTELESYLNETHALHKKRLRELVSSVDLSGVEHETHLLKGDPWKVISEVEKEKKADLVVMGTVARTGLQGLIMGNTAETILHSIGSSVLAVKPDGFTSPVTL